MNSQIGEKLRQARQDQELTIEEVAEATFIRAHYIQALEAGEFEVLPTAVQLRGFVRAYAEHLGLNAEELLAGLQAGQADEKKYNGADEKEEQGASVGLEQRVESIFAEIAEAIRTRRELLGLSLDDVEGHTHIPAHYLGLIEMGDFDRFPSPAQARGM